MKKYHNNVLQKGEVYMSMPTIPDIKPKIEITLEETIKLLLASIALEELSLAIL